jgi:hypothetical protein
MGRSCAAKIKGVKTETGKYEYDTLCDVCQCKSKNMTTHLKTNKHKKNLMLKEVGTLPDSETIRNYCYVCNVHTTNLTMHNRTKKHQIEQVVTDPKLSATEKFAQLRILTS